jgi:hypothetical protein
MGRRGGGPGGGCGVLSSFPGSVKALRLNFAVQEDSRVNWKNKSFRRGSLLRKVRRRELLTASDGRLPSIS